MGYYTADQYSAFHICYSEIHLFIAVALVDLYIQQVVHRIGPDRHFTINHVVDANDAAIAEPLVQVNLLEPVVRQAFQR